MCNLLFVASSPQPPVSRTRIHVTAYNLGGKTTLLKRVPFSELVVISENSTRIYDNSMSFQKYFWKMKKRHINNTMQVLKIRLGST